MESNKLEKPRKNGTFSTLRGVMNPHEEDRGVFRTRKPEQGEECSSSLVIVSYTAKVFDSN